MIRSMASGESTASDAVRAIWAALLVVVVLVFPTLAQAETQPGQRQADATPQWQFVQRADSGALVPRDGSADEYWLKLHGTPPTAEWSKRGSADRGGQISNRKLFWTYVNDSGWAPTATVTGLAQGDTKFSQRVSILDARWMPKARQVLYRVSKAGASAASTPSPPFAFATASVHGTIKRSSAPGPSCIGSECPIENIIELAEAAARFFTERNTCAGAIANFSGAPLLWQADDSKREDSWRTNPPRTMPPISNVRIGSLQAKHMLGWMTVSSWQRGCWNNVIYANQYGTAQVLLADPYSGGNEFECRVTGALSCFGPRYHASWGPNKEWVLSKVNGKQLAAGFCVSRKDIDKAPCDDFPWRPGP
jgi:hypothetical protein